MSLRFICIELRENLNCANVFLQFDKSLNEIKNLKMNINNKELIIKECEQVLKFPLSQHFSVDTKALSNLAVENLNATFRFRIKDLKEVTEAHKPAPVNVKPLFQVGNDAPEATIACGTCQCPLMDTSTLIRICEFPTGAIDSSEFFCHAATEFKNLLVPRICDLYYGFDFIVVNSDLLGKTLKRKSGHAYCGRCLQYLGELLYNDLAVKIWADTVKLKLQCEKDGDSYSDILTKLTIPKLMQKIVDDCTVTVDTLHPMNFAKVLLYTQCSDRTTKYLMIHILEKDLKVLRNETPLTYNDCNTNDCNNNVQEIQLTKCWAFKLLYRFVQEHNNEIVALTRLPAILQFWQQNIAVQTLKISPNLFCNLLHELEQNSMLIPECYRFNNAEFKLSYVFYEN